MPKPPLPFTPEQKAELDRRANERDWLRPRQSRFSSGEQGELDETANALRAEGVETARNLGFNEVQGAELTHRFNQVEEASLHRVSKRFWLFLLSTALALVLILTMVWQIHQQSQINANHRDFVTLCHQSADCKTLLR